MEKPVEIPKEQQSLKISKVSKILHAFHALIEEVTDADPIMVKSLKFKHKCELAIKPYEELYRDLQ